MLKVVAVFRVLRLVCVTDETTIGTGGQSPNFWVGSPQLLSWGPLTYWSSNFQQLRIAKQCRTLAHVVLLCSLLEHIYYDIKRPQNGGCGYRPDVHLDLGLGQGHISMHTTYRTTSIRDHVTSLKQYGNMALWSPVISTFREVWSHVIAYYYYYYYICLTAFYPGQPG